MGCAMIVAGFMPAAPPLVNREGSTGVRPAGVTSRYVLPGGSATRSAGGGFSVPKASTVAPSAAGI